MLRMLLRFPKGMFDGAHHDARLPDGTEVLCRFTQGIKKRRPRLGTP